jgi:hypothetical protein
VAKVKVFTLASAIHNVEFLVGVGLEAGAASGTGSERL